MTFLNPLFLWALPLAALPLLLSVFNRLNRRRFDFPSLDILRSVMARQNPALTVLFKIRQILRVLILALATLAFARPVTGPAPGGSGRPAVVVIDNTVSMSRFRLESVIDRIRSSYAVRAIFWGETPLRDGRLGDRQDYALDDIQFRDWTDRLSQFPDANTAVFVTDGQTVNFRERVRIPDHIRHADVLLLQKKPEIRNLSVSSAAVFPVIVPPGESAELTVQLAGEIRPSDRVSVYLNGREIYADRASPTVSFHKVLDREWTGTGLTVCEVVLTGDDFTNDNRHYFPVLSLPRPYLYNDLPSRSLKKTLDTVFPDHRAAAKPELSDLVFSGRRFLTNKPCVLFTEDTGETGTVLRNILGLHPDWRETAAQGPVASRYPVLSLLSDVRITTRFVLPPSGKTEVLAAAGGIPIAYGAGESVLFPFSLSAHDEYFLDSPVLMLLVHETLQNLFLSRYLSPGGSDGVYYDTRGLPVSYHSTPGVLREKNGGKPVFRNIRAESDFRFFSPGELAAKFITPPGAVLRTLVLTEDDGRSSGPPAWPVFLMGLALALTLLESFS